MIMKYRTRLQSLSPQFFQNPNDHIFANKVMSMRDVGDRLSKINIDTGRYFEFVGKSIADKLDPDEIACWEQVCLDIADCGWHGYEAADAYLKLSPLVLEKVGKARLLNSGILGRSLSENGFEPAKIFFEVSLAFIESDKQVSLAVVEKTGCLLFAKYKHAASLITDYYKTAFDIALYSDEAELEAWSLAAETIMGDRARLIKFLGLSVSSKTVSWPFVSHLGSIKPPCAITYLEYYSTLEDIYGRGFLDNLQDIIINYASSLNPMAPFYKSMIDNKVSKVTLIPPFLALLTDVRLATCLIKSSGDLPLEETSLMQLWIEEGINISNKSMEAGLAFFSLESARSVKFLEDLLGQVNLSDYKRIFELYAKCFSSKILAIDSLSKDQESGTNHWSLASSDGQRIFLPSQISIFRSSRENFAYFKVILLHQLGFFEFGTFESMLRTAAFIQVQQNPTLASYVFNLLEDARVDWRLEQKFRGIIKPLGLSKQHALKQRSLKNADKRKQLFETIIQVGLDGDIPIGIENECYNAALRLSHLVLSLRRTNASIYDVHAILEECCIILGNVELGEKQTLEFPERVFFRGKTDSTAVLLNLSPLQFDEELDTLSHEEVMSLAAILGPKKAKIEEVYEDDLQGMMGMSVADLEAEFSTEETLKEIKGNLIAGFQGGRVSARQYADREQLYRYDEWDYTIGDYRREWCFLHQIRAMESNPEFVERTLTDYRNISRIVRKRFNMLRPQLLKKVKGMLDGEDLDIERAIESIIDGKLGVTREERVYMQRQRKDRDVAALFLVDMSASTDDVISDPEDEDSSRSKVFENIMGKRIIDLEKETVILMADALEELGDSYSICGFSGYGRERVEYFLCKDFSETFDYTVKGRIGGIKPRRSTRMGPAIRHATKSLKRVGSAIQVLIIISDGYPQDFDYGKNRNSRKYGIEDTAKSISEARQHGIKTFCLTVDPAGHDYMHSMFRDSEYMVIREMNHLPNELFKIYRSLTS